MGTWICSQCGSGDGFDLAKQKLGITFSELYRRLQPIVGKVEKVTKPDLDEDPAELRERQARLWRAGKPAIAGTATHAYLKRRTGIQRPPNSIRHVDKIRHPNAEGHFQAMIAKVSNYDGTGANIHITYLTPEGEKAKVSPAKRVMKGTLPDACSIWLGEPAETMGIAEGIETALSASIIHGAPVWAAINGNQMVKWVPPQIVKYVVIYADNDENYTGQAKAYALANKLVTQFKLQVDVLYPYRKDYDWNDVLQDYMKEGIYCG